MAYYSDILTRTNSEFRAVYTAYRYWFSVSGLLASVIIGTARGSMISFRDVAIDGTAGFSISLLGSYLISFIRTPALIDRDLRQRVNELEREVPYIVTRRYPKNIGNAELKKETLSLVSGLKDIFRRQEDAQNELFYGQNPDITVDREQRTKELLASRLRMEKSRQDILAVYWKDYQTKAILLRNELRERLGGANPILKMGRFEIQYEIGQPGVSIQVQDIASELEQLAMQIPD